MIGRSAERGSVEAQLAVRQAGIRMLSSKKYSQAQISETLGVAYGTVRGWSSKLKNGNKSLAIKGLRGRPKGDGKLLKPAQERKIVRLITDKEPRQLQMEFYLWSVGAVMTLIEEKCGVELSETSVRNYLKSWGFTIQRPATRYSSRNDLVVQKWLALEYPKIAKLAENDGAEIHWLDEAGVNNQAIYQRSFAPKGKTPRTTKPSKRLRLSLISTVTNRGTMRFSTFEGGLKKEILIKFLKNLIAETNHKLFIIMDNLPVHKSQAVSDFEAENADKLKIFYLPPYAPDLNPDEYLNNDLKQNVHRYSGLPLDKKRLKSTVTGYLRHIQKSPNKVKSYFQAPETLYAA